MAPLLLRLLLTNTDKNHHNENDINSNNNTTDPINHDTNKDNNSNNKNKWLILLPRHQRAQNQTHFWDGGAASLGAPATGART